MITLRKKAQKISRNISGFTLIELMVVVGIIGILVAIAAPNFARYQSKARQAEAKIALAGIYTGEKSFFSEYTAYVSSMDAIGYTPEGNKRFYTVGFSTTDTTLVTGFFGSISTPSFARVNYPASWTVCATTLPLALSGTSDPQTFTVEASGQVRDGQPCDTWTVDDAKVIVNSTVSL